MGEPAPQCPGSRICAGPGPARLSCRRGRPGRPSGSSMRPRYPPGCSVQKRTFPLTGSRAPSLGGLSQSPVQLLPGGEPGCKPPGQEVVTASVDDRAPCTPAPVPRLWGRWWNTPPHPSRQKGSSGRCPEVTAIGPTPPPPPEASPQIQAQGLWAGGPWQGCPACFPQGRTPGPG